MKKLASVLVTASLVFGLVATAFAAPAPDKVAEGANRLHALGIVNGSDAAHPDDLQLDQQITRAQLMKIMVWAFGQKETASILKGAPAFPDTATHWASGEIAIAKNIIVEKNHETMGMPDGTFQPEGKVTNAQAVAFLMKFIGVKPDTSKTWPNNYLDAAVASGMLSASDVESISPIANNPATRGIVFYLADVAFSSYNMANGKTVYTTYVKPNAPVLNVETPVANTTDKSITINGSVGSDAVSLTVNGTAVKPAADGKFTADVALKVGSNTITVVATDLVKGATTKTFTVARTVGAAAKIDAPATVNVAAGAAVDFKVTISDKDGNALDAVADVTSDVGTFADGKFTAGTAAKAGTITVSYGDLTPVTVNATVTAGPLDKLVISPATVDLNSGTNQKFTATGADAYGNEVAVSSVAWTSDKGVMGGDGTLGATGDAIGTVTVTATAGGKSGTATVNVFGQPAKVQIAAPAAIVANGESEVTVTATVVDAAGNVAKTYNGNVTFSSSNSSVSVKTATVAAVNGVASTTLVSGGSSTSTAVITASASTLAGTTVNVTPVAQVATSVKVAASPSTLATALTGSTGTLTLTLQDQTGNDMLTVPSGSKQISVRLSVGDDGSVLNFGSTTSKTYDVTMDALSKNATIYATSKVGGVTVTGTILTPSGSAVTVNSVSLNTMIVGDAYQLSVDAISTKKANETQNATIRVLDFNGNQLTTAAGNLSSITVKRVDADGTSVTLGAASTTNGKGTINVNTTTAGTYTLKVSKTGFVSAPDVTFSVLPGTAAQLTLSASPSTIQANGTSQSTLTVKVTDQWTNLVSDGSYTVTLKKTTDGHATGAFADTTLTTSNGVATAVVTATTNSADDIYTVSGASGTGLTGATATIRTRIMGSPYKLGWVAKTSGTYQTATGEAGSDTTIKVQVEDAGTTGTALSFDNGRTVTLTVKDGSTVVGTFTGTTTNGVATINVNLTGAKSYTYEASADGLVGLNANQTSNSYKNGSLTVNPASASKVLVEADRTTLSASTSAYATLTVSLADAYDNAVTPSANTDVYLKVTSASPSADFDSTAKITTANDPWLGWVKVTILANQPNFTTSDTGSPFTSIRASAGEGTNVITAKSGTLADGSVTVSTQVTGSPAALNVASITDTTTSTGSKKQVITVTLVDGLGRQITTATNNVTLQTVTGATSGANVQYFVYDYSADNWASAAYTLTTAVAMHKGEMKFAVSDNKADTLTYTLKSAALDTAYAKTASGNFVPGTVTAIALDQSTPAYINGDGVAMTTVSARAVDANNNTVTSANGTVTFSIKSGNDYAVLLGTSAQLVNGVASVAAQSKYVPADAAVTITAKYDVNADGDTLDSGESVDAAAFTVDGVNPSVTVLTLGASAVTSDSVLADRGSKDFTITGSDATSGIASVKYEVRDVTANGVYQTVGTSTTATGNYPIASGAFTDGHKYDFKVTVTDVAGRTASLERTNITVTDTTAPTVVGSPVVVKDTNAGITAGDQIVITFSEPTNGPVLADNSFTIANGHVFGDAGTARYVWSNNNTVLTITLGANPTIVATDAVAFAAAGTVTDTATVVHNFGTGTVFAVPAASNF